MAKHKNTSVAFSTKRIRIGTAHYPAIGPVALSVDRPVPYIRLRGHWLTAAGFSPHDALIVHASNGRIVMTRA